jgi:DNA-binding beta-propeller fold protein YncE
MLFRFLLIMVGCIGLGSSLWGQRVTATIDLETLGEDLNFDVNNIPIPNTATGPTNDLNFSPNVVFSPDSIKAFVSIPGSNQVLVLDLVNGTPLTSQPLLEVGPNPGLMALTPDGSSLCVVSLFLEENIPEAGESFQGKEIGSIAIIDVETLQVRTLDLTEVFFSIGNNMVFSEDGKTGYIASSGTDQIIRFDVDSAAEITPRLDLPTGTRPASLSMAPDHSFFTAVLIGSTTLPQRETPDSVLMIDPVSFTVAQTIVPSVGDDLLVPHDFVVSNTLAISSDGQFGLIGDREFSLIVGTSALDDHAIVLNLQTGETVEVLGVGGITRGSFATPDGKSFVILSDREVAVIDIESREVTRVTPPFTGFKDTTRPAFSKDAPRMFVASAVRDFLMEFDLNTGKFTRSVDLGPNLIIDNNGVSITVPAAPLDVALSPDGTFLTAVKFNANTIALMRDTTRLFIPQVVSNQDFFTGIALTNNSAESTTISSGVLDTSGRSVRDDPNTDGPDFESPEDITLQSGQQVSFTARELVNATEGSILRGWLDLASDQPEVAGFFLIGDTQLQRLDGTQGTSITSDEWILPEVQVSGGFRTEITIVNPTAETASVSISLVNSDGSVAEEISRSVLSNGILTAFLRRADPQDASSAPLFSPSSFTDFVSGYVRISSEDEVVAFERYFDDDRIAALNGFPIGGNVPSPLQLFLPQFTAFGSSETFLNLIHSGTGDARISLSLKDNQGENLTEGVNLRLAPSQSIRINLADLFGLTDPGNALTGWLLLESDTPGVVGDGEIHSFSGQAMTTVPVQGSASRRFVFSHVVQGSGISTGLAFLNPGSQSAAVLVEVFTAEGTLVDDVSLTVGGSERVVGLLGDIFSGLPDILGGYIQVSSDQDIVGLEIFFADNLNFMTAVPAQPLD